MQFSLFALSMLCTIELCTAICCKNHNVFCIVNSIDCTPNCSDGISKCDLTSQVCINDKFGGCVDIVKKTKTITAFAFTDITTSTVYTRTVERTVATSTYTATERSTSVQMLTSSMVITNVNLQTVTQPGATITTTVVPAKRLMHLLKRVATPTTTISVYITTQDPHYCAKTSIPECTVTESDDYVHSVTATATVTTTIVQVVTNTVLVTTTTQVTQVQTVIATQIVVTITQAKNNPPTTTMQVTTTTLLTTTVSPSSMPQTAATTASSTLPAPAPSSNPTAQTASTTTSPTSASPSASPTKSPAVARHDLSDSFWLLILALDISILLIFGL